MNRLPGVEGRVSVGTKVGTRLVPEHVDVEAVVVLALQVDDHVLNAVRVGAAIEEARVLVVGW